MLKAAPQGPNPRIISSAPGFGDQELIDDINQEGRFLWN